MRKTKARQVRYKFQYISLPQFAKQQREMTTFNFCGDREHMMVNVLFSVSLYKLNELG